MEICLCRPGLFQRRGKVTGDCRFAKKISPETAGAGILKTGSLTIWGGAELRPMAHLVDANAEWDLHDWCFLSARPGSMEP